MREGHGCQVRGGYFWTLAFRLGKIEDISVCQENNFKEVNHGRTNSCGIHKNNSERMA